MDRNGLAAGTDDEDRSRPRGVYGWALVDWRGWSTRFVLFTGKGGVGKTTVAAASAVALADAGRRVLLVSTDPASNLADVFQMRTGSRPTSVAGVRGLDVMDLDPQQAADSYRSRVTDPYRGILPDSEIASLEEKLAGACTVEVAAFDTFARLLAQPDAIGDYDHVIFDTAPTGHTLRLLSLPAAWSDYLGNNPDATSCLGPLAGLQDDRPIYASAMEMLRDPAHTTVVLVARPDPAALAVAAAAATELRELGIRRQHLIVNGILTDPLEGDAIATAFAARQRQALAAIPAPLETVARSAVGLVAVDVVGLSALRHLSGGSPTPHESRDAATRVEGWSTSLGGIDELVDELERPGHGVVLVTGKGGVGKTTVARLIALELANRGHRVHLSTTDPAGHAALTPSTLPNLTTSAIDPKVATRDYIADHLSTAARKGLDREHLELLAEDLQSPCSQEVAVFQAFRHLLARARTEFVVLDTAPTGHTLLLLDVTGSFHRQVMEDVGSKLGNIITPLMRLRDPDFSRVLIVASPETTPVAEAAELQDDLRRAGIEPFGWVINAVLTGAGTRDPVLRARAALEQVQLDRVRQLATRSWTLPWHDGAD